MLESCFLFFPFFKPGMLFICCNEKNARGPIAAQVGCHGALRPLRVLSSACLHCQAPPTSPPAGKIWVKSPITPCKHSLPLESHLVTCLQSQIECVRWPEDKHRASEHLCHFLGNSKLNWSEWSGPAKLQQLHSAGLWIKWELSLAMENVSNPPGSVH